MKTFAKKTIFSRTFIPIILFAVMLMPGLFAYAAITPEVSNLKTAYKVNPIGIDAEHLRLSWETICDDRGVAQTAYQIRAALSESDLKAGKNLLWETGKVISTASNQIEYQGTKLASCQHIFWQVKIWDNKNRSSQWSKPAFFETGLLSANDWQASWIEPVVQEDAGKSCPSPLLRKLFSLKKEIRSARIYISSHGLYQLKLNGEKVSDALFTPGWTSYNKRLQYQVYDISSQLKKGDNAIGIVLGDGWYRGNIGWGDTRNRYGKKLAALAQIKIVYKDGTEELIATDNSWKSSTEAILASDIYNGETYDARLEKQGWDKANYNDADWSGVTVQSYDKNILIASESVPVKINETIKPVAKIITPKGEKVFDMGQNMTGWLQFSLQGKAGEKITLKFAEVLDKEGNFYTTNLRAAKACDQYVFKGTGTETYEPHFTFHGFRYVKIEDYQGEIGLENLVGKVIYSNMPSTGSFECSDPLINQLQHNIQWGLRGNFLDVPTDCPQRDERLGWTADAQVFTPTACFNNDAVTFYSKWMKDFIADQRADGAVPHVVPNVLGNEGGSTGWADAAVIIPWDVYKTYGDATILATQYESMKAWIEYMRKQTENSGFIFNTGWHFGDWLAFSSNQSDYQGAYTDKDLIATAYFAHSTQLLQKTAEILGKTSDANNYQKLFNDIKKAFQNEFITATGRISPNTQTAYVLALSFNLLPQEQEASAAKRLAEDVKRIGHITTGFLGTPDICEVLTRYGYADVAYMLLFRKDYPSWLYPVTKGATTIWERWDGIKTDGSFQDAGMNSFNHYAYGAVGNWLYARVAGIQNAPASVGYKQIIIRPYPVKELSFAKASYHSVYGQISSSWQQNENQFKLDVKIPANTTATVYIPAKTAEAIAEKGLPLAKATAIKIAGKEDDCVLLEIGSGDYSFEVNRKF